LDQRGYDAFLRDKIEAARRSMRAGRGVSNEDVEADFAVRRAEAAAGGKPPTRTRRER